MRDDRMKLTDLRIHVARHAQVIGVETKHLPVMNKTYKQLEYMAETEEHGWDSLLFKTMMKVIHNESRIP